MKYYLLLILTISYSALSLDWQYLDNGLFLCEHKINSTDLTILKISPELYDFEIYSSKMDNEIARTAEDWAKEKNLIAAFNAGMYLEDFETSVGYLKHENFINNKRFVKNGYNSVAAFNNLYKDVPNFQIIDLKCQKFNDFKDKYDSFLQSIRMIDCNRKNVWKKDNESSSVVCVGTDKDKNVLFIFSRNSSSIKGFINILLKSPLNLNRLMYLEGGPQASFYFNHNGVKIKKSGKINKPLLNKIDFMHMSLPNIIGIKKGS